MMVRFVDDERRSRAEAGQQAVDQPTSQIVVVGSRDEQSWRPTLRCTFHDSDYFFALTDSMDSDCKFDEF